MTRPKIWVAICTLWVMFVLAVPGSTAAETGRAWTVQDSVGVRYFVATHEGVPGWIAAPAPEDKPAVPSPDGKHFFVVSFHGDLSRDRVVYELQVFAVEDVMHAMTGTRRKGELVQPLQRIAFESAQSDELDAAAIYKPYWESSDSIVFTGVEAPGPHRVYRLSIGSGSLTALTPESHDVLMDPGSSFTLRGSSVIFKTREFEAWTPLDQYPVSAVRQDDLSQIMDPRRLVWKSYASFRGGPAQLVVTRAQNTGSFGPMISPDEKWAIVIYPPKDAPIPKMWLDYEVRPEKGYRYMLIDMEKGVTRPVLDAPGGTVTEAGRGRHKPFDAFWSADSQHVLLFNTALPLVENRSERQRMSYIVDYMPGSGHWSILQPMANPQGDRVGTAEWLKEGSEVLVTHKTAQGGALAGTVYAYVAGKWVSRSEPASTEPPATIVPGFPRGFAVTLRQSSNDPPAMIASHGQREVSLTSADPALKGIWRAPAEVVEWQESDGATGKGLLMLPRDSSTSRPVPLVIQGFSFEPNAFRPDGVVLSGFAAQALVAQGFAVLQIEFAYGDEHVFLTPQEGPTRVARIDAAVEMLAGRGVIDPTRVGLIGFSRGGYSTYYAITHPGRIKLAAAIVFDSITASYGEYVNEAAILGDMGTADYEKQYGTGTFWQNKAGWMDAPSFNIDRVATPVLFSTTGVTTKWAMLETVGAFRYARRPFDYLYYSAGSHQLQRPREREASMQATVDWMNFWLQGRESESVLDTNRLARWRKIREDWIKTQSEDAAAASR